MHIFLCITLMVTLGQCFLVEEKAIYSDVSVGYFQSFAELQTIKLTVKPQTDLFRFHITPKRSDEKCPTATLVFHLQYGSVPLFNITTKTFPRDRYYLHRTDLLTLSLQADGQQLTQSLVSPFPGPWFLSIYVDTPMDKKTKKKTDSCDFSVSLSTTSFLHTDMSELQQKQPVVEVFQPLQSKRFRLWVGAEVWMYKVTLSMAMSANQSVAHIEVFARSGVSSFNQSDISLVQSCNFTAGKNECNFVRLSPRVEQWDYVILTNHGNHTLTLDVNVQLAECQVVAPKFDPTSEPSTALNNTGNHDNDSAVSTVTVPPSLTTVQSDRAPSLPTLLPVNDTLSLGKQTDGELVPEGQCLRPITLLRKEVPSNQFGTVFYGVGSFLPVWDTDTLLYKLELDPVTDIGGNLHIQLKLKPIKQNVSSLLHMEVQICIQKWGLPINSTQLHCGKPERDLFVLTASPTSKDNRSIIYPYPEPGAWFIGVRSQCYHTVNGTRISQACPRDNETGVEFKVRLEGCVPCNNDGYCTEATAAAHVLAYCHCRARYAGYTCDDDSNAKALSTQKTYTLLLTCSNLFFIPGIILAIYRRYYVEALVYFANMFFSAFYHACDMGGWSVYRMCIMPYHVLSYCDFFLSVMSFWVTFVAMANLPPTLKSVAHMTGAIALAMGVEWKSHGFLTDLIPICVGGAVVVLSWIIRCIRYKKFHPKKKAFLVMLPGILIAGGGIVTFELTETDDNYPYTHSMWHMCISLSIVFLLPLRRQATNCTDTTSVSSDNIELHHDLGSGSDVALLVPANSTAYCDDSDDEPRLDL